MQIKTTMRDNLTHVGMTITKKQEITNASVVCTRGNSCELSGGLQTGTTSMENKMEITKKVKNRTAIQYSNSTSGKLSKGNDNTKSKIYLHPKFRLKLKKAGKTTRSFMYDLNQIPYYYTVEVTNRSRD